MSKKKINLKIINWHINLVFSSIFQVFLYTENCGNVFVIEILSSTALSVNGSAMQNTFIGIFVFENGKLLQNSANCPVSHLLFLSVLLSLCIHPTFLILSFFAVKEEEEEIDCLLAPAINLYQHTRFLSGSANAGRTLGIHKMK